GCTLSIWDSTAGGAVTSGVGEGPAARAASCRGRPGLAEISDGAPETVSAADSSVFFLLIRIRRLSGFGGSSTTEGCSRADAGLPESRNVSLAEAWSAALASSL